MTPMTRRKEMLAFSRPSLGDEEIAEILHSMRSGWITTGPKCARFEQDVCEYVGADTPSPSARQPPASTSPSSPRASVPATR